MKLRVKNFPIENMDILKLPYKTQEKFHLK